MSDRSIADMEKEIADLKKENEELKARLESLERPTDLRKAAAALALKSRFSR
jgi:hypothetical protein